jgi:hypothetical protein
LNYAQVKALALSEPLMKEYTEKENELRNARLVLRQEIMQKESAKIEIKRVEEEQKHLVERRDKTVLNLEYIEKNLNTLKKLFPITAEIITEKLKVFLPDADITQIGEFSLRYPYMQSEKKLILILERLGVEYYVEFGDSAPETKLVFQIFSKSSKTKFLILKSVLMSLIKRKKISKVKSDMIPV